jgi:hypothetical protein
MNKKATLINIRRVKAAFFFKRDVSCIQQTSLRQNILNFAFTPTMVLRERFIKRSYSLYSKTKSAWTCESLGTSYSAFATTIIEEAQVPSSRQAFSS